MWSAGWGRPTLFASVLVYVLILLRGPSVSSLPKRGSILPEFLRSGFTRHRPDSHLPEWNRLRERRRRPSGRGQVLRRPVLRVFLPVRVFRLRRVVRPVVPDSVLRAVDARASHLEVWIRPQVLPPSHLSLVGTPRRECGPRVAFTSATGTTTPATASTGASGAPP